MRTLLVIACLTVPMQAIYAQNIYKWEDEKGVIHYGDKPSSPGAVPFKKEAAPFSNIGQEPTEPTLNESPLPDPEPPSRQRVPQVRAQRPTLPSPSLRQPKAWVEYPSGKFWISGTLRNGSRGLCDAPTVEVAVMNELGRVSSRFELVATPNEINKGEDAQFSGNRSAPIGNMLSWEATPRCGSTVGAIYGARKRGSLRIPHSRVVPSKKLKNY